ncbi:MAG: metal ABC transporter substrate-binding protein [Clostridia bacterium]|nr:metal ABC transporter substrate-binding protein [Clostridia bacterium]
MTKNLIKKIGLIFTFILIFSLICSCGKANKNDCLTVVTTVFPQYDFVRNITEGANVELKMLLPPGSEPHSYEPTPADMIATADCDLFIAIGGESEAWADRIVSGAGLDEGKILTLMDTVPLLETENGHGDEGHSHEHTHENSDHDHIHDEHIWTSPKNAVTIVEKITDRLCIIDENNAELYRSNAEKYLNELYDLDAEFSALAEETNGSGKRLVFGDRFPFLYLARAYGFEYTSPFRGCSSHTEASLAEIAVAVRTARECGSEIIFSVDYSNAKLARTIAHEIDATVLPLYSCHTLSADDFSKGIGYTDIMKKNLKNIKEAIGN